MEKCFFFGEKNPNNFVKMTQSCVGEMRKWFGEMTQFVGETTESVGERKQICWGNEAKLLGK